MFGQGKKKQHKKIRKRKQYKARGKRYRAHKKTFIGLGIGVGSLLFIISAFLIAQATVFSKKHTIQLITFAPESIEAYDNPEIYTSIRKAVEGKNYYLLKRQSRDDLREKIFLDFPIIKDISIAQAGNNRAYATIRFHQPTIVFRDPSGYTAAFEQSLFPLVSGNTLGDEVLTIDIPRYTSGYTSLHGILYETSASKLVEQIGTISDTLGEQHVTDIIYLPGGRKLFIGYKGKQVYFHLDQEINRQLAKLIDLENRYQKFTNLSIIDLGSIDDVIVR